MTINNISKFHVLTPKVSIITSVKNGEKYLVESLNSILRQTYHDFELIVIDDYSVDSTANILKELAASDERVKVITNESLPGLSNALNLGIKHATGKYLVRHDADDISKQHRLATQIAYLEKNPDIDILGSCIDMIDESGSFIKLHREPLSHAAIVFHTLFGTPFAHPSIVIRKSFLDRSRISYLEVPAQDYELWVRMINSGAKAENLSEALVSYRVSMQSDSNVRSLRHHQMAEAIKLQQIKRYIKFPTQIKKICAGEYQAVAHYLLTGNIFKFSYNSKKFGKQVIALFDSISPEMGLMPEDISHIKTLMYKRLEAIKTDNAWSDVFRNYKRNIYNLARTISAVKKTPVISLTVSEIQSFIENVHIFIIVRDRLTCLQSLVDWLARAGHKNIILIDNASTYPPLVEFLSKTTYKVIRSSENLGHTALWKIPELQEVINANWFVYTDPDVIPDENCPLDAVGNFYNILLNNPNYIKAGFGLRIDDLPDHYHLRDRVIEWEAQFYKKPISTDIYNADIDTTFALYRPGTQYCFGPALRTMGAYKARHLPWYLDTNNLVDDELYYREHALSSVTTWNVAGNAKLLPIPTLWAGVKYRLLAAASIHPLSYKLANKMKSLLRSVNVKKYRK
ncbi:glycosyltransferase [Methylotenera mobilis]|uniref:Glycosyl transferase family 2 n=1 Tax=Methylotenera mobilis (strain JLW8 / ATCC BAA-1282 / DSM 17540) TaxID=583345 RepID=C6WVJ4_METML|nr:glycosyltransferase [Methylotenera mobilis]ACT47943.1 glycosyl transferase family 2 [Methylotenera mobilis JLW8]